MYCDALCVSCVCVFVRVHTHVVVRVVRDVLCVWCVVVWFACVFVLFLRCLCVFNVFFV